MGIYSDQLTEVQRAITELEGGAVSALIGKTSYLPTQLSDLYDQEETLSVQAAIQTIQETGQSYQIGPRSYTRADLRELHRRLDVVRRRTTAAARGGIRVRRGIPL